MVRPTIVILTGYRQGAVLWEEVKKIFIRNGYEVVLLDTTELLLENDSLTKALKDLSLDIYTKYIKDLPRVVLIGHSLGGRIAGYIGEQNPANIQNLILVASPNIKYQSIKTKILKFISRIKNLVLPSLRIFNLSSDDWNNSKGTKYERIYLKAINDDQREILENIKIPTYIIHPEKDSEVDERVFKHTKELIKSSKYVLVKNYGHNLHIQNPKLLTSLIIKYLENEKQ